MTTFEFQKNDWRSQLVHMFCTNNSLSCPMRAWAKTVRRIRETVPDFNDETPVCVFWDGKKIVLLTGDVVREKLKAVVSLIGEVVLGFSQDEVLLLKKQNCINIQLGPRILRTETAPLAIIAILQYKYGDFA